MVALNKRAEHVDCNRLQQTQSAGDMLMISIF